MTEKSDRSKPAKAPAVCASRVKSADQARAELEKRGITEDDVVDAVRWARAFPDRHA